jgi:hypothetical protein
MRVLPPELVIQDELHLISGPLGTVAGIYEGAIDALASREVDGKRVRPKIVASTATVRRAQSQIRALFDRKEVAVFPPPGADLREANLKGAFLRGLDLHGADLSEANLTNANLSETNLSGAKLTDAVLCGATLHEANLEGANLDGADLSIWQYWDEDHNEIEQGTDLEKANFRSASLINSDFYGAYVVDADFTGANITDANFAYAEVRDCDFTDTIGEGTGYFAEEDDRLKK